MTTDKELIKRNERVHNRINKDYDKVHSEIFNRIEQKRLQDALDRALSFIQSGKKGTPLELMDYGCGSGNLALNLAYTKGHITLADVSEKFLALAKKRMEGNNVSLLKLNGENLSGVADETFDFIGCYSVLHHIPDYLYTIGELARVCKKGGVIFIDHEQCPSFWGDNPVYRKYLSERKLIDFSKYFKLSNYIHRIIRIFNPRHTNEGDIHVWPDDHIEWDKIKDKVEELGFEEVICEDYLNYSSKFAIDAYEKYKDLCVDFRFMAFRRKV